MFEFSPVLSKKDFVVRYSSGEFGNASPTWNSLGDFATDRNLPKGLFHLRNRIAAGETFYNLEASEVAFNWQYKVERKEDWYCSAMCPTERTQIQGEVIQSCYGLGGAGLDLFYTRVAKPMREALAEQAEQVSGIRARRILEYYLCPNSYEWLQILLDRYPGHVIEFTTLDCEWGTVPGYNTLFWEVRGGY